MDTWSERQLKLMALGGNKELKNYFQNFDLNEESVQLRYNTRAADHYRLMIRSASDNIPFAEIKPEYSAGREQIPENEARLADSNMQSELP